MQIIKDNFNKNYEVDCPNCNSQLKYDDGDVDAGGYIKCPCCGGLIFVGAETNITTETISYPESFFSYANGVAVRNKEVDKWVKDCLNALAKDVDYSVSASGDTIVFAYKSDEKSSMATVVVAKKYQECEVQIPKENF